MVAEEESTRRRYERHYSDAVAGFIRDVGDLDTTGIQELHLPRWGQDYDATKLKVVFIGEETNGWGDMAAFIREAKDNLRSAIFRNDVFGSELPFTTKRWTSDYGTTFWNTVIRYLARFHGIADWKEVKRRQHDEILRTFVWANVNSVEGWGVTARDKHTDLKVWSEVKIASERHIDSFSALMEIFRPHAAIVMNWNTPSHYWGRPLQWQGIGTT